MAGIGVKRQVVASITGAVASVGNRGGNEEHVGDKGDYHNSDHIEEVIHSNNDYCEFLAATGRLEQPVNRR
ncbi:MAG: hypothetical protein F4X66_02295 [Chloroflexi bacterium]|nr:hypothetical protein [Chloroflexota bacterium]